MSKRRKHAALPESEAGGGPAGITENPAGSESGPRGKLCRLLALSRGVADVQLFEDAAAEIERLRGLESRL